MAWSIPAAHNEARLTGTLSYLDLGANPAKLRLYNGTRPATGGAPTTLLAEIVLDKPAGTVAGGALTLASSDLSLCQATGTATWARIVNGAGAVVADGDVSTVAAGTGQVQLDEVNLLAGGRVQLVSAVLT
ncbi:MAG: hypothetical protein QM788_05290 [Roseateles sp.]|uniref:hypothetical protein n=1 Tax=Roseateles sp. TaxID=1971397 RepID=UPI0039EB4015